MKLEKILQIVAIISIIVFIISAFLCMTNKANLWVVGLISLAVALGNCFVLLFRIEK